MKPTNSSEDHPPSLRVARLWFFSSLAIFVSGVVIAAMNYPGGFDWVYTVVSSLAAKKHNPVGSPWFSIGFAISLAMLWPYVSILEKVILPTHKSTKFAFFALRMGLISGILMGLERLLIYDWSDVPLVSKGHEILAIFTFVGLYIGAIFISINLSYRNRSQLLPVVLVLGPIVAIGLSQLYLYFDQRDLGWVNVRWRDMGIPIWLSFAFWQWLAVVFLYLSIGLLSFLCDDPNTET